MEKGIVVVFVFLFTVAGVICQQESPTNSSNANNSSSVQCSDKNCAQNDRYYTAEQDEPPAPTAATIPPFWCPDGYQLLRKMGHWLHVCQPLSCAENAKPTKNVTSSATNVTSQIQEPLCSDSFTSAFNVCPKMLLDRSQYGFGSNGSLINLRDNYSVELGEYFIQFKKAMICDPNDHHASSEVKLPGWCMPIDVPKGGYKHVAERLYVDKIDEYIDKNYFSIDQTATAHVCSKMHPTFYDEECLSNLGVLEGNEINILPNLDIQDKLNVLREAIYKRGEYMLADDQSFVIICIVSHEILSTEASYAYGVLSCISALCLLLALLAHLFFPTLNYHAKALLCLAFSFFVMYIAMAVRNFAGNFDSAAANVTLFAFQYIFALAAFFWLSVLGFDLWRVFANLKGTINPGYSAAKKRQFFAKCAYAFGIPVILCVIAIAIAFSPNVQRNLKFDFQLHSANWFIDGTATLTLFYIPITIVLLENVVFFILTIVNIRKASSGTDILNKKVSRKLLKVYAKLFLVMGLCWFAEIISWFVQQYKTGEAQWYVTDIINCLQGMFIFLVYVCKKKTWLIIKNKLGHISSSQATQSTSSSQDKDRKTSVVSLQTFKKKEAAGTSTISVDPNNRLA